MSKFNNFYRELQKLTPEYSWEFKENSWLMKVLGILLFFNPKFSTSFATTLNSTTYLPVNRVTSSTDENLITLLAHEYYHVRYPVNFFLYLIPQILAPFCLFLLFWTNWAWLLFAIFLLPWPAYWRKQAEFNAYCISLLIYDQFNSKTNREINLKNYAESLKKEFTSFNYYLMWIFGVNFDNYITKILSNDLNDFEKQLVSAVKLS